MAGDSVWTEFDSPNFRVSSRGHGQGAFVLLDYTSHLPRVSHLIGAGGPDVSPSHLAPRHRVVAGGDSVRPLSGPPDEVNAAKAGWLQERLVERADGCYVMSGFETGLFQGRTYKWDADLEERVGALTPEQILAALRRHIDPARISIVKAGDFLKKQ